MPTIVRRRRLLCPESGEPVAQRRVARRRASRSRAAVRELIGRRRRRGLLERPSDPEHGDSATTVALRLAPVLRRPPRDGAELATIAQLGDLVQRVDVAGPGFLNLTVGPAWYEEALAEILGAGDRFGSGSAAEPSGSRSSLSRRTRPGP